MFECLKFADNILKGFAASYSIVVSLIVEMVFFEFHPTSLFLAGVLLVNLASYLYARPDPVPQDYTNVEITVLRQDPADIEVVPGSSDARLLGDHEDEDSS